MILLTFSIIFPISSTLTAVIIDSKPNKFKYYDPTPDTNLLKEDKLFWYHVGNDYLTNILRQEQEVKKHVAKNVVILIGDGMGIPTITASRIYTGQRNFGKSGEDYKLVYEKFPNVALVKTYNVDMQVPDSAGTATAIFTGVKTRYKALGVDASVTKNVADPEKYIKSKVESIMDWAQKANKDTGIITTTRITHATPASTYANVHFREWECDSEIPQEFKPFVKDIARQLIEEKPGKNFKVILGGGAQQLGHTTADLSECARNDSLNLTQIWIDNHKDTKAAFVTNNEQLSAVDDVDYLFGSFHYDHLPYELLRDKGPKGTPSLSQMASKGLDILKKSPNGFVLMIEGGRIDHGHHDNRARLALEEAAEFERTIDLIVNETESDTLILVTADHSHAMTINGYSKRGNDILGYGIENEDDRPALTLTYANGPGFNYHYSPNVSTILGPWIDVRDDENRLNDPEYKQMATYQLDDETHGGEDVGIFAVGPGSHLVRGVFEQNYIAHMISYVACIGPRAEMNSRCYNAFESSGTTQVLPTLTLFIVALCYVKTRFFN